jgi:hypothetical protein
VSSAPYCSKEESTKAGSRGQFARAAIRVVMWLDKDTDAAIGNYSSHRLICGLRYVGGEEKGE